jgi:hypothetical protein
MCDGDPGNDLTSIQGRKHEPYTESRNSSRPKKAKRVESKVKSMLIILFDVKGIIHKEFNLEGQTVNSAYYCDFLRQLCEDFAANFEDKRTGCRITTMHRLTHPFSPRNFWPKATRLSSPHPSYLSVFPRLKIKLKCRHFDRIKVFKAESQAVLNILTEHDFQDAFRKCQKH